MSSELKYGLVKVSNYGSCRTTAKYFRTHAEAKRYLMDLSERINGKMIRRNTACDNGDFYIYITSARAASKIEEYAE